MLTNYRAVTFRGRANHYYKSSGSSYEQAESMNRRALAGYKKVLGVDHPNILTSVYCLAHLLSELNDHHQAFDLYERAIIGYSKLLGPEHPNTVACQRHKTSLLDKVE